MMLAATEPLVEATREFTFAQPAWLWVPPLVLLLLFLRRRPGEPGSGKILPSPIRKSKDAAGRFLPAVPSGSENIRSSQKIFKKSLLRAIVIYIYIL